MTDTAIGWTDQVWNPVTGCSKVSEGCRNCYAEAISLRYGRSKHPWSAQFAAENVVLHPDRLGAPLKWKKPARCFVNSMSDLFHEQVPDEYIDRVFAVMAQTPQHTYQILTKRPERMARYVSSRIRLRVFDPTEWREAGDIEDNDRFYRPAIVGQTYWCGQDEVADVVFEHRYDGIISRGHFKSGLDRSQSLPWPLPNVWLGTSVENQQAADERIPHLLRVPAAVRFLSCEPLLGPVDLYEVPDPGRLHALGCEGLYGCSPQIKWVIVGGESGPKHRPMNVDWARSLIEQCTEAGVPVFTKQDSGMYPGRQGRIPDGLWLHEFPAARRSASGTPGAGGQG